MGEPEQIKVAVVGASGVGKTSLIRVLTRGKVPTLDKPWAALSYRYALPVGLNPVLPCGPGGRTYAASEAQTWRLFVCLSRFFFSFLASGDFLVWN